MLSPISGKFNCPSFGIEVKQGGLDKVKEKHSKTKGGQARIDQFNSDIKEIEGLLGDDALLIYTNDESLSDKKYPLDLYYRKTGGKVPFHTSMNLATDSLIEKFQNLVDKVNLDYGVTGTKVRQYGIEEVKQKFSKTKGGQERLDQFNRDIEEIEKLLGENSLLIYKNNEDISNSKDPFTLMLYYRKTGEKAPYYTSLNLTTDRLMDKFNGLVEDAKTPHKHLMMMF